MRLSLVCVALSVLVLATGEETGEDRSLAEITRDKRATNSKPKPRPRPCPGCYGPLDKQLEKNGMLVERTRRNAQNNKNRPPKRCPGCFSAMSRPGRQQRDTEGLGPEIPEKVGPEVPEKVGPKIPEKAGPEVPETQDLDNTRRRMKPKTRCHDHSCSSHRHHAKKPWSRRKTEGEQTEDSGDERRRRKKPSESKRGRERHHRRCPGCLTDIGHPRTKSKLSESFEKRIKRQSASRHRLVLRPRPDSSLILNDEKSLMKRDAQDGDAEPATNMEETSPSKAPKKEKHRKKGNKNKGKKGDKPHHKRRGQSDSRPGKHLSEPRHQRRGQSDSQPGKYGLLSMGKPERGITGDQVEPEFETMRSRNHKGNKKGKHRKGEPDEFQLLDMEMIDGQDEDAPDTQKRPAHQRGEKKRKHEKGAHSGWLSALGTSTMDGETRDEQVENVDLTKPVMKEMKIE
ncbi:uncharacterized protein O3C94_022764 isoform 2-T2 [Discoglossus pictus]